MESQCEYFMYFPAVPITDLSDPARYRSLPRRSHLYLGETVRFLLVLRCRDAAVTPSEAPGKAGGRGGLAGAWRELAGSLCAVASVSPGENSRHRGNHQDYQSSGDEDALGSRVDSRCRSFRDCKPLLIHNSSGTASPLDEPVVLTDEVIFPLTVSLDKLPVNTLKVKVSRWSFLLQPLSGLFCVW
uniref:TRAPP14 N-terminal domain-containing protein n=1 Tax=Xiphophorus couchianus TaxID=32473 RepID=A0A3B5MM16_9TELE